MDEVVEAEKLVAELLMNITVGMAFSLWSPLLLLFSATLCPLHLLAFEISRDLNRKYIETSPHSKRLLYETFCLQLAAQIKAPTPNKLVGVVGVGFLQLSMLCTLFDYGFGVAAWCVFFVCIIVQRVVQWQSVRNALQPGDPGPVQIEFTPNVGIAPRCVAFVRDQYTPSNEASDEVCFAKAEPSDPDHIR